MEVKKHHVQPTNITHNGSERQKSNKLPKATALTNGRGRTDINRLSSQCFADDM